MGHVAIIGAGVAGLTAARHLRALGHSATLFEKSSNVGGRLSTRQTRDGHIFDHGAQFVRAKGEAFQAAMAELEKVGAAALWEEGAGGQSRPTYVGTPYMRVMAEYWADGLDIRLNHQVQTVVQNDEGWLVEEEGGFAALICAIPENQASVLLSDQPLLQRASNVETAPCWAVMLAFEQPVDAGFETARNPNPILGWVARDSSKPGRDKRFDRWVLHASPDWSAKNLERDPEEIVSLITASFAGFTGALAQPVYAKAHRWRYAMTKASLSTPCLVDEDAKLVVAGDWCLGARVEAAFDSGFAAAQAATTMLKTKA